ncbi:MAG: hypothetical protein Q7P63_12965 [Verrucomicrobiota bacterium JB022]|nr:hypothetical protein [Verrucomicrobiota bacterium JB022]
MWRQTGRLIPVALLALSAGCIHVKTDPIKIEPIYVEVTINYEIQRELDDIFGEIDAASTTTDYEPLAPATETEER